MNCFVTIFQSSIKRRAIVSGIVRVILFLAGVVQAAFVDTTLFGDGGPGPYSLGASFADTSSFTVSIGSNISPPPWTYIPSRNGILFSQPIDSGAPIRIAYTTLFYGVPKIFSLYEKRYPGSEGPSTVPGDTIRRSASLSDRENLNVSGYKSVGVSVGSFGQVNLEQGLDVRIGGEIGPQTLVDAHLSDQGSSLDGATREISDFDMIYLSMQNPSYKGVAGDQYVRWIGGGILDGQKKIKGLSAALTPVKNPFSFSAFGALSGGNFAIETKQGKAGVQGPYYLIGKGESDLIQPVGGTVRVRINGRELTEGFDKDFIIDYDFGTITFTPKVLVRDEDLLRIEYEYKVFNYQRTLAGATVGLRHPDSLFSVRGVLWSENDDRNHPIDLQLAQKDVSALENAGDNRPLASSARPVHPNDVARESEFYPLYRKRADPRAAGDSIFIYTPFDIGNPQEVNGYYYVWFRPSEAGRKGNYRVLSTDHRGRIFYYAGRDSGDFTDETPIPAPQRSTSGELVADINLEHLKAALSIAGQDRDRNLFSKLGDADNQASATRFSFTAGSQSSIERCAWISGTHRFASHSFDGEAVSAWDRKNAWNDVSPAERQAERQQWDVAGGATVVPGMSLSLAYGQDRGDKRLVTDKVSPSGHCTAGKNLDLDYTGSFFRHLAAGERGSGRRENGSVRYAPPRQVFNLLYRDEWRDDSLGRGSGLFETGLTHDFAPLGLSEAVYYMTRRKQDGGENGARDTGYSVRWEQSLHRALRPWWKVSGSSSYYKSVNYGADGVTTMLIDLENTLTPQNPGFASRQHYRTSSERASAFVQVPFFAGKGMGTHVYDTLRHEYVPHVPGDYFLQQQEVYDQASLSRVRKTTADVTWSYCTPKPVPGIVNDLMFEGALFSEEHVDADNTRISSWAPGYVSLSSPDETRFTGSPVRYADLSYRQGIDWKPKDSAQPFSAALAVTPGYRKIRNYRESSIETGLNITRTSGALVFGFGVNLFSLKHEDSVASGIDYTMYDRRLDVSQVYKFLKSCEISCHEIAGTAMKKFPAVSGILPFDSTLYIQVIPGFSWVGAGRGRLTVLYTYSFVTIPGELDYRMARGFESGTSHKAIISTDIKMGTRLLLIGSYRGDLRKPRGASGYNPGNHVFSLEVKAFL